LQREFEVAGGDLFRRGGQFANRPAHGAGDEDERAEETGEAGEADCDLPHEEICRGADGLRALTEDDE
jgi:hypothetical protein